MADPYAGIEYFPQSLPINTVLGRLGNVPGPAEAISFATLAKQIAFPSQPLTTTALLLLTSAAFPAYNKQVVTTFGRQTVGDMGGGEFYYDATDTTTPDNNNTVRVDANGRRWKFISPGFYNPALGGEVGDNTNINIPNILNLISDQSIVDTIRDGENAVHLDAYFATAIAIGGSWFLPPGWYFVNNKMTIPAGMEFHGAGIGVTTLEMGGSDWSIEQLNPNGVLSVEGLKMSDMTVYVSAGGIRQNSITGGFTDDNTSQYYIVRPYFKRVSFIQNSGTGAVCLQFNKCFNGVIEDCTFKGFANSMDIEGSDITNISHNRVDDDQANAIYIRSHGTFGGSTFVTRNDINNPNLTFISTNGLDTLIADNHMELDFLPSAGMMTAMIDVVAGNAFHTRIHRNRMQGNGFNTNWLRFRGTNTFTLEAFGNTSSSLLGSIDIGTLPYFSGNPSRIQVRHGGNSDGDAGLWPFNTEEDNMALPGDTAALFTTGRRGVNSLAGLATTFNVFCRNGDFRIAPNSDVTKYIEFSDYSGYPANTLPGTFTITLKVYSDTAGQVLHWVTLDGAGAVSSGTITCTNANQFYSATISSSVAFTTKPVIRVYNSDTGHGGNGYVRNCAVKFG